MINDFVTIYFPSLSNGYGVRAKIGLLALVSVFGQWPSFHLFIEPHGPVYLKLNLTEGRLFCSNKVSAQETVQLDIVKPPIF
jgi:hypothetical protein